MARSKWLLPAEDPAAVKHLCTELGILPPAARVLATRGYADPEKARAFLNPRIEHLHDPYLLRDMDRAADRLARAIANKEKILLYGDYDVDGTSSVVILKKVLDVAGADCGFYVPHRLRDGYGMRSDVMDQAARDGVQLVISVDTGIRAAAVVAHARELGIDVIVTDHHLPEAELPPAVAVINPNRPDCAYPEKGLCGAGVTFKLVQALLRKLAWPEDRLRRMTESLMKLVAVATVADVVPLTGENRIIVKRGLEGFDRIRNAGLRALLKVAGFREGQCPSSTDVAFRIAPRMNAAGRMDTAEAVIRLFLTDDAGEAETIAAQLHEQNQERRDTEAGIVNAILESCDQRPVLDDEFALVFSGTQWHKGVVGIVASRIVERFHRPVFVLSEDEELGVASGSGRSIAAFHLLEALESMGSLFTKFGGHRQAAGITLPLESLDEFRKRFNEYAARVLTPEDLCATREVDAVISLAEIDGRAVDEVLSLAPFGMENQAPSFAVLDAEVCSTSVKKEKHLWVNIRQNGRTLTLKGWNMAERVTEFPTGGRVDCIVQLQEDSYNAAQGFEPWCAVLRDVRAAAARSTMSGK